MMTKRQFCLVNNIEPQAFRRYVELGILSVTVTQMNGCTRTRIDPGEMSKLIEGEHYVICPFCFRKALVLSKKHHLVCNQGTGLYAASALYSREKKKTENQKKAQSEKLKRRFQTPEGEETRKVISEASLKYNARPEVKKARVAFLAMLREEHKDELAEKTRKRWMDPVFRTRFAKYVAENIDALRASAAKARSFGRPTSKLHLSFKSAMVNEGIQGFLTEQMVEYYSVDELNWDLKIALEIDGCYWHGCEKCGYEGVPGIRRIDHSKQTYLSNRGWTVVHVKEHEIHTDLNGCIARLKSIIAEKSHGSGQDQECVSQGAATG